jgi:hypothetical protein
MAINGRESDTQAEGRNIDHALGAADRDRLDSKRTDGIANGD